MRVLLVNHFPLTGSGSGVYTANIANSLCKLGHDVCVIYPENCETHEDHAFKTRPVFFSSSDSKDKTSLDSNKKLPFNFPCFTTHPRSNFTFEEMSDEQLNAYTSAFQLAIEDEIEKFKPDVLHCGHIWILSEICSRLELSLVITSHGTDLMGIQNSPTLAEYALDAAKKCNAIISISKGNLKLLKDVLPDHSEKFHLITNGYNSDVFYPEKITLKEVLETFEIKGNYAHVISFAGKFANFKGIDVLLRANAIYDRDDTATILAGDGELFDEMAKLKNELGLKNTFFIHNQPHDKLRKLYSAADVSLVPSRNEPFGLVAIEAGACGAPIIASKSGGLLDIVTPKTGLFFEQENHEELAKCVQDILDKKSNFDRKRIAEETYSHFSQDIFTRQLVEEVYQKVSVS